MSSTVLPGDVVVGILTENTASMLVQAIRLVRSIRWFGGELAGVRIVACGVGELEAGARATLESLGVEIRTVTRFHPANPTGNRHQLLAELLDAPEEVLFLLDCDTIVVRDPLPYLRNDAFQAKVVPTVTVTDAVFDRLFAHFALPKPPRAYVTGIDRVPTVPYFNAGVIAIPKTLARTLAPVWRRYNVSLADNPELVAPCQRHMHQASLTLALIETGIPVAELPPAMNFQLNATHLTPPPGFAETDPAIIHYHYLATDDGFLLPCPYPQAQQRIEMFHERMLAEGFTREESRPRERESRAIVVAGMHRSGTSLVAQLVHALGVYAGQPDELTAADMFNPTGYWEHRGAFDLDREILGRLTASWSDVGSADLSRLPDAERADYVARAEAIARSLHGRGPFLLKDPRMSLLFPLWQQALGNPVCVIAWRDPVAVARSLATRDGRPLLASIAVWEHHLRTLLRDTAGVPRVLVSYEQLLAEPLRTARELHEALTRFGVPDLTVPSEERLRQIVHRDFDRSSRGIAPADHSHLDADQRALVDALRSGAALREPVAPTSPRTLELLAELSTFEQNEEMLRGELTERDLLLSAVFQSRSWRVGQHATGVLRLLKRTKSVSAEERWNALRER
jgi:hypothetical protein